VIRADVRADSVAKAVQLTRQDYRLEKNDGQVSCGKVDPVLPSSFHNMARSGHNDSLEAYPTLPSVTSGHPTGSTRLTKIGPADASDI
jgi:hypothetical protein